MAPIPDTNPERLPIFVYGTLRPGQDNAYRIVPHAAHISPARVYGLAVYGEDQPWPHAITTDTRGSFVCGDLIWIHPKSDYRQLLDHLDEYEDVNRHAPEAGEYERISRQATAGVDVHDAWVYVATGPTRAALLDQEPIPDGNWLAARLRAGAAPPSPATHSDSSPNVP
jgi:gamma-glutamylcyclotransferase (GGCT)/AIG2-like uncharacterized protein YtfP